MNNLYISPEFEVLRVEMTEDVIMASPEDYSSTTPTTPGDWGDPTVPSDEDIEW